MVRTGRPRSVNPRSFTIPEVRVTREEKIMINLKAALNHMTVADLIREAVKKMDVDIPKEDKCPYCGERMELVFSDLEHQVTVADKPHNVTIENVPHYKCTNPKCGKELGDLHLAAVCEKAVEDEIYYCLNNRLPLPTRMDLKKFIQA